MHIYMHKNQLKYAKKNLKYALNMQKKNYFYIKYINLNI